MKLTFVFPCLNEEGTLADCVAAVRASLDGQVEDYEIVVADNGSSDRSREIAEELGCRVVPVETRGYGAALRGGIEAAEGEYVMFADADMTYCYEHAAPLYAAAIEHDADMAIASRMTGDIEPGAMPTLHRRLGTPVLTGLINVLFGGKLTDCNSGFRCLRKSAWPTWDVRSTGMEFASELLVKALKSKAKMVEIRSGLRRGPEDRVAHLRTWRDGMRHLLFILSEKPALFAGLGGFALLSSSLLQLVAVLLGPTQIGGFSLFDVHTKVLLLLAALVGTQFYLLGCSLYLQRADRPGPVTRRLIHVDEGVLFFTLLALGAAVTALVVTMFVIWAGADFEGLYLENSLVGWVHLLAVPLTVTVGLLSLHVLKKGER